MKGLALVILIFVQLCPANAFRGDDRLTQAACNGDVALVQRYLKVGDKPTDKSIFCASAYNFNAKMTRLLLSNGGNANATYQYINPLNGFIFEMTMLQYSVHSKNREILDILLSFKPDLNLVFQAVIQQKVEYGTTALALAAAKGNLPLVELLLAQKADPNADRSAAVFATVTHATEAQSDAILSELIAKGANLKVRDANQKTVCDVALERQQPILLLHGGCN